MVCCREGEMKGSQTLRSVDTYRVIGEDEVTVDYEYKIEVVLVPGHH